MLELYTCVTWECTCFQLIRSMEFFHVSYNAENIFSFVVFLRSCNIHDTYVCTCLTMQSHTFYDKLCLTYMLPNCDAPLWLVNSIIKAFFLNQCVQIPGGFCVVHIIFHLMALTLDPADPNIRGDTQKGKAIFDRSQHEHVIENCHCYICQADV